MFLDGTVVNVALPAIRDDLGSGLTGQQWVVEGFLLTLGALLLLGGSLGDLLGRRRVFVAGTLGFGVASLICAVAASTAVLVAGRALQGVAGALLVPSTLALITDTFPPERRAAAIGTWTAWTGAAVVFGPVLGGLLVDEASWRWVFAVNLPLVAAVLAVAPRLRPDPPRRRVRVDWTGATLAALGLGAVVVALTEQPRAGWAAPQVWATLLAGVGLLAAFVAWERRAPAPMLPAALFAERDFAVGNAATLAVYAGLSGGMFLLVIFLQQVAGYSALTAGAATMPVTVLMLLLSKRMGALADRRGPRLFMGIGPILCGAGYVLLLRLDADIAYASDLLPGVALFGVGLATTVAPLTATVLSAAPEGRAGVASAVNNAVARVAALLAIGAVGAAAAAGFTGSLERSGLPPSELRRALERPMVVVTAGARSRDATTAAAVDGLRAGLALSAALMVAGGVISLLGIADRRRRIPAGDCPAGQIAGAPRPQGSHVGS